MQPANSRNGNSVLMPDIDDDTTIKRQLAESIQRPPEVSKDGIVNTFAMSGIRGTLLPAYGTRARLFAQRDWYRMDEQTMLRGAFTGIAKGFAGLPWEISGEASTNPALAQATARESDSEVEHFQNVFRQANFGDGWTTLAVQIVLDYLRYDTGAFIEVIAPGESHEPIDTAITGIAHLDPLRCLPTGDPVYPVIYYDRWGGLHVLHHHRVIQIQDSNDGDDLRPGYGDSSLSRAISIAARQMWETRYITAYLDDKPAPGLDLISGILKGEFERAEQNFKIRQAADDGGSSWGNRMRYYSADGAVKATIESHTFQSAPEKFDYRVYVDIDVDMLALAMGVDRQELMQLTGANIGSQGQSIILHQKSKGKTIGNLIAVVERKFNDLLPEGMTFAFRYRDEEEARAEAEKAKIWAEVVATVGTLLTDQQKQVLLASQSEAIHDAMSDAPRANDVDIMPELPVIAGDDESGTEAVNTAEPLTDDTPFSGKALEAKYDPNQPRDDDGKFDNGGGGGGSFGGDKKPAGKKPKPAWSDKYPNVKHDADGNPEWLHNGVYGQSAYRNPAYTGKPSGKKPFEAPSPKEAVSGKKPVPANKPDKPDTKPTVQTAPNKPQPKPEADKPQTGAQSDKPGKKPEWGDYRKRKPGVDAEGYQDYAGMDNDTGATNRAYELSDSHTKTLTRAQKNAAETYTGGDYTDINGGLRSGKVPAKYKKTVAELDTAIGRSKLPEDTVLYRGMSMSPEMSARMKPGATFSDSAYTSTSINPRIPDSFARGEGKTLMRIKARKGQSGLAVNNISNFDGEHEVLLPRGTSYRVTKSYYDKKTGMNYVDLEIVGGGE